MRITVKKSFHFYAAHRNGGVDTSNKCYGMHGHTYHVDLLFGSWNQNELDGAGMTIDFGEIDDKIIKPLHNVLDHSTLMSRADYLIADEYFFPKVVIFETETSVEHLAIYIYNRIKEVTPEYAERIHNIAIRETESSTVTLYPHL